MKSGLVPKPKAVSNRMVNFAIEPKKWGTTFKNYNGDLPGVRGSLSPYKEYRVSPPLGSSNAGPRRIVKDTSTGEIYYTWTHYGDSGKPAFVKIR